MARRRKRWSYVAGERPHSVTVYEREPGGVLYAAAWDPSLKGGRGAQRRISLKHRDKERAKAYAHEQTAKLKEGSEDVALGRVKLSRVFATYMRERTPRKTEREQKGDARRVEMWACVLGGASDPHRISLAQWERFIRDRLSGAIDGRGNPVEAKKRRPVRARAVEAECNWLRWSSIGPASGAPRKATT